MTRIEQELYRCARQLRELIVRQRAFFDRLFGRIK